MLPPTPPPVVLVIEDDVLIGLSLQDDLEDAAFEVAGPFTSCDHAKSWLEHATPTLAILDIHISGETCEAIAAELNRREVPLVVFSGSRRSDNSMPELEDALWIEKPTAGDRLTAALVSLLEKQAKKASLSEA